MSLKIKTVEVLSCDAGWRNYHFVKILTDAHISRRIIAFLESRGCDVLRALPQSPLRNTLFACRARFAF